MALTTETDQQKHYSWPIKGTLRIFDGRGKELIKSHKRIFDLADALMLCYTSRTVILTLSSASKTIKYWNEELVSHYEKLIRYDLAFDGYRVSISRQTPITGRRKWSSEFRWKLRITTPAYKTLSINETKNPAISRKSKPSRFRIAKSDASISSIQKTIEQKFALPAGSVRLIYPNGRKARSDSTVGILRVRWEDDLA